MINEEINRNLSEDKIMVNGRNNGKEKKENTSQSKKYVNVHLKDQERVDRYEELKKHLAIKDPDKYKKEIDVMRFCIDRAYETEVGSENIVITINPVLSERIKHITSNKFLKEHYLVSDATSIAEEAIKNYLHMKRTAISLHNLSYIKNLQDMENKIAMIFLQNQVKHPKGMSIEEIKEYTPQTREIDILKVLQTFIDSKLVDSLQVEGVDRYFVPLP